MENLNKNNNEKKLRQRCVMKCAYKESELKDIMFHR